MDKTQAFMAEKIWVCCAIYSATFLEGIGQKFESLHHYQTSNDGISCCNSRDNVTSHCCESRWSQPNQHTHTHRPAQKRLTFNVKAAFSGDGKDSSS